MLEEIKKIINNFKPRLYVIETSKNADGVDSRIALHMSKESPIMEEYRILRTNLNPLLAERSAKTLLVTSSQPGEGKTITSCNLAIMLSWSPKKKIALVDADLRKSDVSKLLNIPGEPGLSDLIMGKCRIEELIRKPNFGNLYVIPAGSAVPRPAELLNSSKIKDILSELKNIFDIVVIDSAPIVGIADSRIIGEFCDGALFVVKAGVTSKDLVKDAIASLESAQVKIMACILTNYQMPLYQQIKYKGYYNYTYV